MNYKDIPKKKVICYPAGIGGIKFGHLPLPYLRFICGTILGV
jgi:hypothetical protein